LKRSEQIGLIVPDLSRIVRAGHAFSDPNLAEVLSGIEDKVSSEGYKLILLVANESFLSRKRHLEVARDRSVDGLLLWGVHASDTYMSELLEEDIPCLQVRSCIATPRSPGVVGDDQGGARMVTEHLLKLGHRCIGYLGGPEEVVPAAQRRAGFKSAIKEYKQTRVWEEQILEGEFTEEGGFLAARRLLRHKPVPTAIVALNDMTALGVYRAIRELGLRIPQDISVVGGDGIDLCRYIEPSLTTFSIPCFEIGLRAAERMIKQLEGKNEDKKSQEVEILPAKFQSGQSTAPPA